jgi:glutaconate CoA-transferase subunit B
MSGWTTEELMACVIARAIHDGETVSVGTLSPIPATGAYLAQALHAPRARLLVHGARDYPFRNGTKEFFDFAQRGRIDLFFLSGAQIDAHGNINLHAIGPYERPAVRLPGGAGSGMLYYMARRVILFKMEHDARGLVEQVDFVTSAAEAPQGVLRRGGPVLLVTPLCLFRYDAGAQRLRLASVHPGVTLDEVRARTGWVIPPAELEDAEVTPPPSEAELVALRGPVRGHVEAIYPEFAARVWGEVAR